MINFGAKGTVRKRKARSYKEGNHTGKAAKICSWACSNLLFAPVMCIFEGESKVPANNSWENKRTE